MLKKAADLRSLERKGSYSRNDYLAAIDKITKAKNEIARERANHRMDVYEKLNDDQKKIFSKMPPMGRRGDGMGPKGMGKHRGGRMGMGDDQGMGMIHAGAVVPIWIGLTIPQGIQKPSIDN